MSQSLFEIQIFRHLTRKFPTCYGIQKLFTTSTTARHLPLLWAKSTQPMFPSHFLRIHFDIILQSLLRSSKWSLYRRSRTKNLYALLLSSIRATCSANLILLYFITPILFGEQYRSLSTSLCSFLYSPLISSLLGTLSSNTLRPHSSLNTRDHVLHPYKQQSKLQLCIF